MSFKENLKKKMLIDTLSRTVSQSIGSPERPWKVDKETMRRLLSLSPFVLEKRRDLGNQMGSSLLLTLAG